MKMPNVYIFRPSTMTFQWQRRKIVYKYNSDGTKELVNREYKTNYRMHAPRKERQLG